MIDIKVFSITLAVMTCFAWASYVGGYRDGVAACRDYQQQKLDELLVDAKELNE